MWGWGGGEGVFFEIIFQMAARHVPIHVAPDECATKCTRCRMLLTVLHLSRRVHHFQLSLPPHHMINHRRRPLVHQVRQLRQGDMRLRQIPHVHNSHIMKVLERALGYCGRLYPEERDSLQHSPDNQRSAIHCNNT